jgi:branched-chain amino acid transport system ATP-binding protein
MILSVEQASAHYGKFQALFGIDLRVSEGQTVAVIGANGAGKSTLLSMITGLLRPTSGYVRFDGADLRGVPAYQRPALGIAMVPEGRKLFPSLTVRENLQVGAYRSRPGRWDLAAVYELFPNVARLRDRKSGSLSGGEAQAVAIGRALMSNPRLLLLDEVSLGLAPVVVKSLYSALADIKAGGATVLLVEQDVSQALAVADHVYCLLEGRAVLDGPAAGLSLDQVTHSYFGAAR